MSVRRSCVQMLFTLTNRRNQAPIQAWFQVNTVLGYSLGTRLMILFVKRLVIGVCLSAYVHHHRKHLVPGIRFRALCRACSRPEVSELGRIELQNRIGFNYGNKTAFVFIAIVNINSASATTCRIHLCLCLIELDSSIETVLTNLMEVRLQADLVCDSGHRGRYASCIGLEELVQARNHEVGRGGRPVYRGGCRQS